MSACLLHLFLNKLNAYEPEIARRDIIPEVQDHFYKIKREEAEKRKKESVFHLRKEWLSHHETWAMLENREWGDEEARAERLIMERCEEIENEIFDMYQECLLSREEFDEEYSEFVDEETPDIGYCPNLDGSVPLPLPIGNVYNLSFD